MPKIISERCELVKLCHVNYSGPVFLDTLYMYDCIFVVIPFCNIFFFQKRRKHNTGFYVASRYIHRKISGIRINRAAKTNTGVLM